MARDALLRRVDATIDRATVIRMNTVTVSPKFQVVIPQEVREQLALRSGEKMHVIPFRDRIELVPVRGARSLRGMVRGIDTRFVREPDRA